MARYGYARVSSTDQDCALQEARLRQEGCKVIRTERVSGKSRAGRDGTARIGQVGLVPGLILRSRVLG
jgi:DNA invertase Pin-like site-specific DNA recombinase